jgi:hypothetical protein
MSPRGGGEAMGMAAAALLLLALELPLLVAVVGVGLLMARAVGVRIDRVAVRRPVPVALPAFAEAPLQLVGAADPSTKSCPACAATVLGSAPVCRRCHFSFPAAQRRAIRYTKAPAKAS